MAVAKFLRIGLFGIGIAVLAGCSDGYGGGYGRGPAGLSSYDGFYGNSRGWRSVPFGYAGAGFGWYDGYYYPGNGGYRYDRVGRRFALPPAHRAYWAERGRDRPAFRQGAAPRQWRAERRDDRRDLRDDRRRDGHNDGAGSNRRQPGSLSAPPARPSGRPARPPR